MSIIKLSKQIADPRVAGRTVHKMEHIIYITILTSSLKKHAFYNLLINNILYLCVT